MVPHGLCLIISVKWGFFWGALSQLKMRTFHKFSLSLPQSWGMACSWGLDLALAKRSTFPWMLYISTVEDLVMLGVLSLVAPWQRSGAASVDALSVSCGGADYSFFGCCISILWGTLPWVLITVKLEGVCWMLDLSLGQEHFLGNSATYLGGQISRRFCCYCTTMPSLSFSDPHPDFSNQTWVSACRRCSGILVGVVSQPRRSTIS